jgi:hypothetical protein
MSFFHNIKTITIRYIFLPCVIFIFSLFIPLEFNFNIQAIAQGLDNPPLTQQNLKQGEENQENFGFKISHYPIQHKDYALLDLTIDYRINSNLETINPHIYPDFTAIAQDIKNYLVNYPNEKDYWEIVNRKLTEFILNKYENINSLKIKIEIYPTLKDNYFHYTEVIRTRLNQ